MKHIDNKHKEQYDFIFRLACIVCNNKTNVTNPDDDSNSDNQIFFNLFHQLEQQRKLISK